ncbi:hypothetical protein [Undibacterium rugosum]|uniref:Uncharacterized protein n=1 Tax=Undibacterium rugosum TaxID=2762291 RepID=A0A923KZ43_9BURK|nr:hypothetical protein [Undibacterium rugosum]MBC3935403.1 hypothetical protein [Undibacterium rugosum]MBR7778822.1 hypothetical protein [Undibacterium rugosum]
MSEISSNFELAVLDQRPFFETALRYGVQRAILTSSKIAAIETEAPKGMVQIAEAFGSKYLRPEIELARKRIVNLASLYLLETSGGDLEIAAKLIRDNTFLTLSRGGSGLLKALFAMPEYALLGREVKGKVEDFLEAWSLRDNPADYRQALEHRQQNALEIEAGFWFGEVLGLSRSYLQDEDAEAVGIVRSALLVTVFGGEDGSLENQVEFATLVDAIRGLTPKERVQAMEMLDISEVPLQFHPLVRRIVQEICEHDLPLFKDKKASLDKLVFSLKDRYYLRDHEIEDTSAYDALVSKEWTRLTKGKTDVDSLMTLFVCIAAGVTPKTSLPEKNAKSIVKKFRERGFTHELASQWIKTAAPHEKQEGLLEDWDNFIEEANNYLMDDWDSNYSGALRFLSLHCHIESAVR